MSAHGVHSRFGVSLHDRARSCGGSRTRSASEGHRLTRAIATGPSLALRVQIMRPVLTCGCIVLALVCGSGAPASGPLFPSRQYDVGWDPRSVAVGDLNGDGWLDLAVANHGSHDVSVLLNNGDGTFGAPVHYATGEYAQSVAVGDLNSDEWLDVAVAN